MPPVFISGTLWDVAFWDQGLYDNAVYTDVDPGYYTTGYCPDYLRFKFSGVNLGEYIFFINPTSYNAYPQRNTSSYPVIAGSNPTIDPDYDKLEIEMQWGNMPADMWNEMLAFSRKRVDGTSETLYFWDGAIGRFSGVQVKVEDLKGTVRGGYTPIDRLGVSLMLRKV